MRITQMNLSQAVCTIVVVGQRSQKHLRESFFAIGCKISELVNFSSPLPLPTSKVSQPRVPTTSKIHRSLHPSQHYMQISN